MKKIMILSVILAVVAVLAVSGCAHYGAQKGLPNVEQLKSEKLIRASGNGVEIAAFPLKEKEDAKRFFGEDLLDDGILAVYVKIANSGVAIVELVSCQLQFSDGSATYPMAAEDVYKILKREYVGKAFLWWFAMYIGAPISAIHTYEVNKGIKKDIGEKLLHSGDISPGSKLRGFVWFRLSKEAIPKNEDLLQGIKLRLILRSSREVTVVYSLAFKPSIIE